jgi:hypothetical protein
MTARTASAPRVSAADLKEAARRLAGTVIHDLAGIVSGPAVYVPRLAAFASVEVDGPVLGEDDGTLIDLLDGVPARVLIDAYGTARQAAAALNAKLRAEWSAA